jgi:CNT family concentrative nucleoside transporter
MDIIRGAIGVVSLLAICFFLSTDKKKIDWRLIGMGVGLQILMAVAMLKIGFVRSIFQYIVDFFVVVIGASDTSANFLFGDLAIGNPANIQYGGSFGFAFFVLPTIIFFSALSSLLYYMGILQKVVYMFAWIMNKTMRLSGAESLAVAANIFIGQTEAPLIVKPYLEKMSKSEIMTLMTGGMATIAGGVFGAYMAMLGGGTEEGMQKFGMHLLTASIISAPAAVVAAKLLFPETRTDVDTNLEVPREALGSNFLDALSTGTAEGLKLALNVGAMLLAFMAIIYLLNDLLVGLGGLLNVNSSIAELTSGAFDELSMQFIFGILFAPIAWLIGIPADEILQVGQMLGEKTILNEFVAYASLQDYIGQGAISERSALLSTYALLGFANFASIGIQIGGIGGIAPNQRKTLTSLGFKALVGGTVASLLTAAIVGMIL